MAGLSRGALVVLARAGAIHRIAELEAEIDSIRRAFPGIGSKTPVTRRGPGRPPGSGRRRRKMSAEGRKRISDMMKKRWAERKKTAKATR